MSQSPSDADVEDYLQQPFVDLFPAADFLPVHDKRERPRWLGMRREGIGSSDAAKCIGLSRYGTPLQVWADKLGLVPDKQTNEQKWGTRLEEPIGEAYGEEEGCDVAKPRGMYRSKALPWMLANIDLVNSNKKVVEVKCSRDGKGFGEPGTDLIPEDYILQGQHQMAVLDVDEMDLAVLVAGTDFRVYTIRRDKVIQKHLTEIEGELWDRVTKKLRPAPDHSHPTTAALLRHLDVPDEKLHGMNATQEQAKWAAEYNMLGAEVKKLTEQRDEMKAKLEAAMGTQPILYLPNGEHVRRKLVHRKGYQVKPGEYVDFRILKTRGT